ncbi:hypothetical protein [Virgibacillus sp. CBA3643]|uniref:hypothetical protein n=1 Tax=Virgibacillus sp. CBA3643 TaxID=2942278 RepID=UPI0035A26F3B
MDFMSWSLNAPSSIVFDNYMQKTNGKWEIIDETAIDGWGDTDRNFFHMYEKYHDKIGDFGLHEFGVNEDGTIYDYRATSYLILNDALDDLQMTVPSSLQYLMETYPNINYSIQPINFGQKVDKFLHVNRDSSIPTFINHLKTIAELYQKRWPMINCIELDFEKIYTLNEGDPIYDDRDAEDRTVIGNAVGDDWNVYADFVKRVKDEICIPLGMKLRVNMYAMTGDFNPHYYGWHDYKTLASRTDINGNQAIDEFQIMSYDFTYAYSAPGPSTPLWWLKEILNHVDDSLPNDRTWIGNAGYGRRWGLDAGQPGSAVTFHQLLMWQNGMYVHNHSGETDWIWHNQPWLPFAGFNDESSGYQVTYPHLYDKFLVNFADVVQGTVNNTTYSGNDIVTSYFKSQQPIFTNIRGIANNAVTSGNIASSYTGNGEDISGDYLGSDTHFSGAYRANKAQYQYDEPTSACVPVPDETGTDGNINFDFDIGIAGNYKLIALVHFNTYANNQINGTLNGTAFTIGGDNIEEWWPFFVDKSAWIDVGSFDFQTSNTINLSPSSGFIWGFVVCDDFDQNFLGGTIEFDSNVQPYYKRDSNGEPTQASIPENVTLTGEILRRPPRPAIIFEDTFSHMLSQEDAGFNFTTINYYMNTQDYWDSGETATYYETDDAYACTDSLGIQRIGFSDGTWELQENGTVKGVPYDVGYTSQLVLYRKFSWAIQVRADIAVSGTYPKAGIRVLANEEGNGNEGYLALLDYSQNKVVFGYENGDSFTEIASEWMSDSLVGLKGSTTNLYASIHKGVAYVTVGERNYITVDMPQDAPNGGAYGVYITDGEVELSLFNISTLDRWEPLEKMEVEVDGNVYEYGEVTRTYEDGSNISYDDYGYLVVSGLDIEGLGQPDPDNPENEGGSASLDFSQDFQNIALAEHPAWQGQKPIRVRMKDAGIWFTQFYVGDSEGFSVAYNSDLTGFIETTNLLFEHNCKGIAMWTIGQEDPLVFQYLPS